MIPFVSVYGRSGSGKSTVVKFVCENLDEVKTCFVNLRKAKTIFGCANLILAELGIPNLKSAKGLNVAIDEILSTIDYVMNDSKKELFVLVLDEFDSIFSDKRNNPSEFVYKLVNLEEKLRELGHKMIIIGISNNVVSEYGLDDRVLSRIGNSEVFFGAYSKKDVLAILKDRADRAFSKPVPEDVLQYCAELGSMNMGTQGEQLTYLGYLQSLQQKKAQRYQKSLLIKHQSSYKKTESKTYLAVHLTILGLCVLLHSSLHILIKKSGSQHHPSMMNTKNICKKRPSPCHTDESLVC